MADYAQTYGALRGRVADLVGDADDDQLDRHVPAAPEWRVRDVVAHLSGVTADINAGNLDGVATDAWTARQVDARRDWSMDRLLEEWDTEAAKVEAVMATLPEVAVGQMTMDAATHEQDIRGGLERPGARDCDAVAIGFDWGIALVASMADQADTTLLIETDTGSAMAGSGARQVGLRVERYELFRTMTGRRSADQIRAFDWDGEPAPELLVFSIFEPRATPLVE
ncbi:MAG TPA: maleylpyruvate isomerase N-terminal domain-containing protein [Acidimicrobiia bacterium]|nr:maleylpyruvate isomerase N-terminal domain-containing protein [Acidimicrobiia bacterium]